MSRSSDRTTCVLKRDGAARRYGPPPPGSLRGHSQPWIQRTTDSMMNACTVRCSRDRHAHFEHAPLPLRRPLRVWRLAIRRDASSGSHVLWISLCPYPPYAARALSVQSDFSEINRRSARLIPHMRVSPRRMIASRSYVMASPTATLTRRHEQDVVQVLVRMCRPHDRGRSGAQ
jgi:hypothetical protein